MKAVEGLKQVAEVADPRVLRELRKAGMMSPLTPLAVGTALPWLLGRGPSLGVVSQMNSITVGSKPAIRDRYGTLTWKELDVRANRVASALRAHGVKGGDSIAMVVRNGREFVEFTLAAQKAGIIACPLNTWAKPREMKATLANSEPSLLLYDVQHADQVERSLHADIPLVWTGVDGRALQGSISYDDFLEEGSGRPPRPFTLDTNVPKVVIHTSGTTGTPKGARRDASAAGLGSLAHLLTVVPYRRNDVVYCPAPLFHSFGLATFTFATALGATLVLPERYDPEASLEAIERHRATAAAFVPVMIRRILDLPEDVRSRYDLSSLRIVMASGSAMSPDLRAASNDLFGGTLYDLYGSTEVGWVSIADPDSISRAPKSVGRPVPGVDVAIFSEDGHQLGSHETGEIFVRTDVAFDGYTSGESRPEREGYISIGDAGHFDEDGYLYVEGRADDMVVVGGENIYPIEVEEVIESVAGVREVAVMGIDDDEFGQALAAFVEGDASAADIEKTCKEELASYKVPKRIEIVDELPRTATGKVIKRELIASLPQADVLDDAAATRQE